jgi:hypothetical protein
MKTMRNAVILSTLVLLAVSGCAAGPALRVSTAQLLPPDSTRVDLPADRQKTVALLKRLMAERGLSVKAVAATRDGHAQYVVFSGPRRLIGTTYSRATVGSWIAARVEPMPSGTRVQLLGKPNLGGQEVCSDADVQLADAEYWCRDTRVNPASPYYAQMTGREEAELIRGLMVELQSVRP